MTWELRNDDRPGLTLGTGAGDPIPLEPAFRGGDSTVFHWPSGTIRFPAGSASFELAAGRARAFRFRR